MNALPTLENNGNVCLKPLHLFIQESQVCGIGVFSDIDFLPGDLIECCPLLLFAENDMDFLQFTNLYHYHSLKDKAYTAGMLALGFGCIYNHGAPSNAMYSLDIEKKTMNITAVSSIKAGDEITINYHGMFNDVSPIIFATKNETYEFSVNLF